VELRDLSFERLGKARNCAWVNTEPPEKARTVWSRAGVFSVQCPKSIVTAQSLQFLEQFGFWKQFGGYDIWSIEAKSADALALLEQAWQEENQRGKVEG